MKRLKKYYVNLFYVGSANDMGVLKSVLGPGQEISGRLKLDVRKKTRYLKSLIVQLDGNQFANECDRTNNTEAVILD